MNTDSVSRPVPVENCHEPASPGLGHHLAFVGLTTLALLGMQTLLRLALMLYNHEQAQATSVADLMEAFLNGLRFDLRLAVFAGLPLLLAMLAPRLMASRRWMLGWLTLFAGLTLFLGVLELDFYREFNQRLNGLVFQYMKEDPKTVLSMIWFGFPVVRYLLAWGLATWLMWKLFRLVDRIARPESAAGGRYRGVGSWRIRIPVMLLCLAIAAVAGRGTLRQGSPLRWGDAFTTESVFANQLGLNGTLSLVAAATAEMSSHRDNIWKATMPAPEARDIVRKMLLTSRDTLVDADTAAVRRDFDPPADKTLPIRNVVVILMESFVGRHVGALGASGSITPYFDKLAGEGVLFTRFFSNGTHTHQGMFASFGCFPNLPGFEYLMKQPESNNNFSGLSRLLSARDYDNLYVYNGDFAWDNQSGFFGKQGVTNFIGRMDFVDPVVFDPTWGVADQDMFDRAAEELAKLPADRPFYAMLQTLSNHTPYPIPEKLPVEKVTGHGALDEHLTAMRYSDWALGQFFEKVRKEPFFKNTLFVIVGDHGFASGEQLTEVNLIRFNVPLLLIGPGIKEKFGSRRDTVGTQIDIVPTIMGRLGGRTRHQCWGRDLLDLPAGDSGFGIIKPSGSDQTVAMLRGDRVLVKSRNAPPRLYEYHMGAKPAVVIEDDENTTREMRNQMEAFLQTATRSLFDNTTGSVGK